MENNGKVTWLDNKVVRVLSTAQRRCRTGDKISVPCPQCIHDYNRSMGGVDRGDQNRGYYRCRTKFRKFYMYIYSFLKDVCITNSYILYQHNSHAKKLNTSLAFRLQLAKELIGNYSTRKRQGTSIPTKTLLLSHFPMLHQDGRRGRCHVCKTKGIRKDTLWFCQDCNKWFCHTGKPSTDCFLVSHRGMSTP